jgi:plasmid stability protein
MAQLVVRDLEDAVKASLKRLAERHGRSMEEEIRHILRDAVKGSNRPIAKLGSRIAERFSKAGLNTDLPELHGESVRPADFKR